MASLQEFIDMINFKRKEAQLKPINISTRPSKSVKNANTIEISVNGDVVAKSINGGAINWFLRGMLQAYQDVQVQSISNFSAEITAFSRKIEFDF